jgi:formate dehydrogenase subunit gamma
MATQTQSLTERKVLRYRIGPRINHAILAGSFVLLLLTGAVLLWQPLAGLAAGGNSRLLHRIAAVFFMAVPILYLLVDRAAAKELLWDSFRYDKDDLDWAKQAWRYFLGHTKDMPPQGRLNAGQKLHHAAVVIMSALVVASGLVLWFAKGSLGADGLALAAMVHDISMFVLTILLIGHLYFTFVYKALGGMTSGYIPEAEARLEHSKWVAELPQEAPYVIEEPAKQH